MGEGKTRVILAVSLFIAVTILLYLSINPLKQTGPIKKTGLIGAMANARQVYSLIQAAPAIYPADAGIRTNRDYIKRLVESGAVKESDLPFFCKDGVSVTRLEELRDEDLAFAFANLSASDVRNGTNLIFLASRRLAHAINTHQTDAEANPSLKGGYIVMKVSGDASFYARLITDTQVIGTLPAGEPKFLEP